MRASLLRLLINVGVPAMLTVVFVGLVLNSDAHGAALVVALVAFLVVVGLWALFRELALHATATRLLALGEADELIAMAERYAQSRLTERRRAPFWIYLACGHIQRGEWDEADRALRKVVSGTGRRDWDVLWASAKVTVLVERGDAAGARALYEKAIAGPAQSLVGAGAKLVSDDAQAKLRFAEGDHAGAMATFKKLAGDIRLGPAARATAHWYAGRCALALGDRAAADRHLDEAAALAPKTHLPRSAVALRAGAA